MESNLIESLNDVNNYLMIDIGANLTNRKFAKDLDSVVQRAKESGVNKIIVLGTSVHLSKEALRLSRLYPDILYCTAGIHPHDSKQWNEESEQNLREIAQNSECVAIGECGLDFNRDFSPREIQLEVFEKQVRIACDLKQKGLQKPLLIHERDAHKQLLEILEKFGSTLPPIVIHCFTGNREEAQKYIDLGFYIGLTGFLWKDTSDDGLRKILQQKIIPLDRLMIESDSPWCYPNTRASKLPSNVKESLSERSKGFLNRYCTFNRNEPCSLAITCEMIASYMELSAEEVALKTTFNALKVFSIS